MTLRHEHPTPGPAMDRAAALRALVPPLATKRLSLRAPRLEDFDHFANILCTEQGRFVGGPMSRTAAWSEFTQVTAGWFLHGHGAWTIEQGKDVMGFVLIGIEPGDHERELGYLLTERAEGQGIATEAAKAAHDFAFSHLRFETLVSYIDLDNAKSFAVAERLGGARDAKAEAAMNNRMRVYRYPAPANTPGGGTWNKESALND